MFIARSEYGKFLKSADLISEINLIRSRNQVLKPLSLLGSISNATFSTFSPEGRLFQVEYSLEAIKLGSTAIGVCLPVLYRPFHLHPETPRR